MNSDIITQISTGFLGEVATVFGISKSGILYQLINDEVTTKPVWKEITQSPIIK